MLGAINGGNGKGVPHHGSRHEGLHYSIVVVQAVGPNAPCCQGVGAATTEASGGGGHCGETIGRVVHIRTAQLSAYAGYSQYGRVVHAPRLSDCATDRATDDGRVVGAGDGDREGAKTS